MTTPTLAISITETGTSEIELLAAAVGKLHSNLTKLSQINTGSSLSGLKELESQVKGMVASLRTEFENFKTELSASATNAYKAVETASSKGVQSMMQSNREDTTKMQQQLNDSTEKLTKTNEANAAKIRVSGAKVALGNGTSASASGSGIGSFGNVSQATADLRNDPRALAAEAEKLETAAANYAFRFRKVWAGIVADKERAAEAEAAASLAAKLKLMKGSAELAAQLDADAARLELSGRRLDAAYNSMSARSQARTQVRARSQLDSGIAPSTVQGNFGSLAAEASAAAPSLQALKQHLEDMPGKASTARASLTSMAGAMDDAHSAARGLASGFGAMWLTWGNIAPLLAGAAISHSFVEIVKQGAEVNHTFEIMRVLSEESTTSIASLNKEMLELARSGPFNPREISEAMKTHSLAGLDAKEVSMAIKDVMNFSIAGTTSIKEAADVLTTIGVAFKIDAAGFGYISDVISKSAAISKSSVEGMGSAFKQASVINVQYGASLEDVGLGLAVLANVGVNASAAGTSLRNFYIDILGRTPKVEAALKALNLDFHSADGGAKPLVEIIKGLDGALSGLTAKAQDKALANIFSQRGGKEAIALWDALRSKARENSTSISSELLRMQYEIENAAGFTARAVAALTLTPLNQMKSVSSALQATFAETFDALEPQILSASSKLKELFGSEDFKNALQNTAVAISNLIVFVTKHAEGLGVLLSVYVAFKVVGFVAGMFTVLAEKVVLSTLALTANAAATARVTATQELSTIATASAAATTTRLTAAQELGVIASGSAVTGMARFGAGATAVVSGLSKLVWLLGLAVAAYQLYSFWTERGAKGNMDTSGTTKGLIDSLDAETKRLNEVNALMEKGKSAQQAEQEQRWNLVARNADLPLIESKKKLAELQANYDKAAENAAVKSVYNEANRGREREKQEAQKAVAAQKALVAQQEIAAAENKQELAMAVGRERFSSIRNKELALQKQQAERARTFGDGTMPDKAKGGAGPGADNTASKIASSLKAQEDALKSSYDTQTKLLESKHKNHLITESQFQLQTLAQAEDYERAQIALIQKGTTDELQSLDARRAAINAGAQKGTVKAAALKNLDNTEKAFKSAQDIQLKKVQELADLRRTTANDNLLSGKVMLEAADKEILALDAKIVKQTEANKEIGLTKTAIDALRATQQEQLAVQEAQEAIELKRELGARAARDSTGAMTEALQIYVEMLDKAGVKRKQLTDLERVAALKESSKALDALSADLDGSVNLKSGNPAHSNLKGIAGAEAAKVALYEDTARKQINAQKKADLKIIEDAKAASTLVADDLAAAYQEAADKAEKAFTKLAVKIAADMSIAGLRDNATVLDDMSKSAAALGEQFKGLTTGLSGMSAALKHLADVQAKETQTGQKDVAARVGGYGELAGAAKNFFDKGSAGYKALSAVETAAHLASLAMNAAKMVSDLATVGPSILAGAGEMFAQSGWAGFAGVAAMLAVMAGLGGSGSGGGIPAMPSKDRQALQGTGTVLGDDTAKSSSIGKSLDLLASNTTVELAHSSAMLIALNAIRDGIAGMATFVAQTAGLRGTTADGRALGVGSTKGALGFSSSTTELVDTGIVFGRMETAADKLYNATVKGVTRDVWQQQGQDGGYITTITDPGIKRDSAQTIGTILNSGVNAQKYADTHTDSSSWWGLSKSSSDNEVLGDLPKALKDQMALTIGSLYDGVLEAGKTFSQDKAGLQDALKNLTLDDTGLSRISLKGLSGDDIQKELEAVFSQVGDVMARAVTPELDKFQKVGEGYMQTLIRVSNGVDVAQASLDNFGIAAINFRDIINKQGNVGAEIFRQSVAAVEGASSGIMGVLKNVKDTVNDLTAAYVQLRDIRDSLRSVGKGTSEVNLDMLKGSGGLSPLQTALHTYEDKFFTDAEKAASKTRIMAESFQTLGLALPADNQGFRNLATSIDTSTAAGSELFGRLMLLAGGFADMTAAADAAKKTLTEAVTTARTNLITAYQNEATALNNTINKFLAFSQALAAFRKELDGPLAQLSPEATYLKSKVDFQSALDATHSSDQTVRDQAFTDVITYGKEFATASKQYNATSPAFFSDIDKIKTAVDAAQQFASTQVSDTRLLLNVNQAQLTALGVINTSVLTVTEALAALSAAMKAAGPGSGSVFGGQVVSPAVYSMLSAGKQNEALSNLYEQYLGRTPEMGAYDYYANSTPDQVKAAILASPEYASIPHRAGGGYTPAGLTWVGEKGPELVNFKSPSQVYTAAQSQAISGVSPIVDTMQMSHQLMGEMLAEQRAMVRQSGAAYQEMINLLASLNAKAAKNSKAKALEDQNR